VSRSGAVADADVHPVYVWVGGLLIALDVTVLFAAQSAASLRVARWLLGEAEV
jgi:hypothetical protein